MSARVAKHLRHNEGLLRDMLRGLREYVLAEYKVIEQIGLKCYNLEKVTPSSNDLASAINGSSFSKYFK